MQRSNSRTCGEKKKKGFCGLKGVEPSFAWNVLVVHDGLQVEETVARKRAGVAFGAHTVSLFSFDPLDSSNSCFQLLGTPLTDPWLFVRFHYWRRKDATFFTVVPVALVPGLDTHVPGLGWICPEASGDPARDVVLMTGEFVQVLSEGEFPCCVHRILRPGDAGILV